MRFACVLGVPPAAVTIAADDSGVSVTTQWNGRASSVELLPPHDLLVAEALVAAASPSGGPTARWAFAAREERTRRIDASCRAGEQLRFGDRGELRITGHGGVSVFAPDRARLSLDDARDAAIAIRCISDWQEGEDPDDVTEVEAACEVDGFPSRLVARVGGWRK